MGKLLVNFRCPRKERLGSRPTGMALGPPGARGSIWGPGLQVIGAPRNGSFGQHEVERNLSRRVPAVLLHRLHPVAPICLERIMPARTARRALYSRPGPRKHKQTQSARADHRTPAPCGPTHHQTQERRSRPAGTSMAVGARGRSSLCFSHGFSVRSPEPLMRYSGVWVDAGHL